MSKINNALKVCFFVLVALVVFSCKTTPEEEPVQEQPPVEAPAEEKPVEKPVEPVVEKPVEVPVKEDKSSQITELGSAIEKARQKAIESGAQSYLPEILSALDAQYADALKFAETSSDQDEVLARGKPLLDYYEALENACISLTLKARIEGFSFQSYDMPNYELGVESLSKAESLYTDGSGSSAVKEQTVLSHTAFQAVMDAAFMTLAQEKRQDAVSVRADADAIKAGAADKPGYNSAMLKFTSAETKMAEKSYENAYNLYVDSHNALLEIYERVLQKRKAAEEAIARAKSKTEAVDRYALEADTIAPLPAEDTAAEAVQ
ncbi:MAG: hypothetical protein KA785_07480 [Spirochaetaceae bacterium]|nr:hypothetical protein [Spirochaetaceae bacterium]